MHRRVVFLVFSFFLSSQVVVADCDSGAKTLGAYLDTLPRDCKTDQDCEVHYLHADSCAAPQVLRKLTPAQIADKKLLKLQSEARKACLELWMKRPVCSPLPARAVCLKGKCENAAQ